MLDIKYLLLAFKNKKITIKEFDCLLEQQIIDRINNDYKELFDICTITSFESPDLLPILSNKGFDIHKKDANGSNIYHYILYQNPLNDTEELNSIKALLFFEKEGVNIDCIDKKGNNVLSKLIYNSHYKKFYKKHILNGNIDIDHQNNEGETVLIRMVKENIKDMLFLLELGADPYIKDFQGLDAFEYAKNPEMGNAYKILNDFNNNKILKEKFLNIKSSKKIIL